MRIGAGLIDLTGFITISLLGDPDARTPPTHRKSCVFGLPACSCNRPLVDFTPIYTSRNPNHHPWLGYLLTKRYFRAPPAFISMVPLNNTPSSMDNCGVFNDPSITAEDNSNTFS